MGLTEDLLRAVDQSGLSDRELSQRATGNADAIRNIRRGARPRTDTVEALCSALGMAVYIVRALPPPRDDAARSSPASDSEMPCQFLSAFRAIADGLRRAGFEVRERGSRRRWLPKK